MEQNSSHRIFENKVLNETFLKNGYVTGDFIPLHILDQLNDFYQNHQPKNYEGFHTTHFSTDTEYKKQVNDGIIQIIQPILDTYLEEYIPVFANFMLKTGGGNNPMPLHADWTYVYEPEYISIAMWIPLVDTTPQNSCLGVIPYSQHLSKNIRGPKITQVLPPYDEILIKKAGKLLPMKAGQAVIYDHRLLHYSPANKTDFVRPALNISIVPQKAKLIHYTCPEGSTQIHKYMVDDFDFFVRYNNFQIPEKGQLIGHEKLDSVPLIHDNVGDFIKQYGNGLMNKIKGFFK